MKAARVVSEIAVVVFVLYAAEAYFRMSVMSPAVREAIQKGQYDTRTKLQVILDLRRKGIQAYPSVLPIHFDQPAGFGVPKSVTGAIHVNGKQIYPVGGISHADTLSSNDTGVYITHQSDEYGFNNPPGLQQMKDPGIAAVGDSYAYGDSAQPGENAMDVVRSRYPNTLNFGVRGAGPLQILAAFREYVEPIRPRVVLWLFAESNDFSELGVEAQYAYRMAYLDKEYSQGLRFLQDEIDRQMKAPLDKFLEESQPEPQGGPSALSDRVQWTKANAINFLTLGALRAKIGWYRSYSTVDWALMRSIISLARDATHAWGGEFYVVYIPYRVTGLSYPNGIPTGHQLRPHLFSLLQELSIPTLDLREVFEAHPDPGSLFPFRIAGHPNAMGYRLMGEAIIRFISERSR